MPYLVAAVVLFSAIATLNLLLTLAVIRKLRQSPPAGPKLAPDPDLPELPAGSPVPSFHAEAVSGRSVSDKSQSESEAVYAFFDSGCSSCRPTIPRLLDYAKRNGLTPDQIVAVVGGEAADAGEYVDALDGRATVILEETLGPVAAAFSIHSFPAFVIADPGGVVRRSGDSTSTLAAAAV
jgi:thiol-disulfide isomerase/thioredoxin